jgi:ring-1,2-phenylacetyl-CoA epoxidase subunit PaaD
MSPPPSVAQVREELQKVEDPEAPISIVELGLVKDIDVSDPAVVRIELVPTYRSCPAKSYIAANVRQVVAELAPDVDVEVRWDLGETWTPARLSDAGRESLREFGVAVAASIDEVACPHCASANVVLENRFGCAVCKSLYYCPDCRNPFEVMRGSLVMPVPASRAVRAAAR